MTGWFGAPRAEGTRGRWSRRRILNWGLRGAAVAVLGKGWYNTLPRNLELTEQTVAISGMPEGLRGLRIAQLTDLHASWMVDNGLFRRAAELLAEVRPDLIVLTGDFISGSTKFLSGHVGEFNPRDVEESVAALASLKAPLGIYGVLGNHDFWSGAAAVDAITRRYTAAIGVHWLRNSGVTLTRNGAAVDLLGVDDYWEASCSLSTALKDSDARRVRILLSHNPDINEEIESLGARIDLVVSGHTHGGQVVLPLIGQPVMPSKFGQRYRVGLVADGARQTFIGRGIGHLLAPTRIDCPPEVALLTLV